MIFAMQIACALGATRAGEPIVEEVDTELGEEGRDAGGGGLCASVWRCALFTYPRKVDDEQGGRARGKYIISELTLSRPRGAVVFRPLLHGRRMCVRA
jgi:hypothetical protein